MAFFACVLALIALVLFIKSNYCHFQTQIIIFKSTICGIGYLNPDWGCRE